MALLRKAWETWKRVGRIIGDFIGRAILTIFFFTLLAPFGAGVRLFGDPLAIRPGRPARWVERKTHDLTLDDARRLS